MTFSQNSSKMGARQGLAQTQIAAYDHAQRSAPPIDLVWLTWSWMNCARYTMDELCTIYHPCWAHASTVWRYCSNLHDHIGLRSQRTLPVNLQSDQDGVASGPFSRVYSPVHSSGKGQHRRPRPSCTASCGAREIDERLSAKMIDISRTVSRCARFAPRRCSGPTQRVTRQTSSLNVA
jgi:hypothetical protein